MESINNNFVKIFFFFTMCLFYGREVIIAYLSMLMYAKQIMVEDMGSFKKFHMLILLMNPPPSPWPLPISMIMPILGETHQRKSQAKLLVY